MSRIRSIHPGLWTDEVFVSLSPFARLLFMGIWNECDDKGTFPWSPLQMKMRVLPADNVDAVALMAELEAADCIRQYEVDGKKFGAVRNFAKFQRPKAPNDIHPKTSEILTYAGHSGEPLPKDFPKASEKPPQMEDGGKDEVVPPTPRKRGNEGKTIIPEDWKLPSKDELPPKARACAEQWTRASYETHGEAFHGYWRSSRRMNADWVATWANRVIALHSQVMRDQKFGNAPTEVANATPAKAMTPAEQAAFYRKIGRDEDAEQIERRERKRQGSTGPPRAIGDVLRAANG